MTKNLFFQNAHSSAKNNNKITKSKNIKIKDIIDELNRRELMLRLFMESTRSKF